MFYRILAVTFVLLFATPARADCTDPVGTEGEMVYNSAHKVMQFCDGDQWWSMRASGGGSVVSADKVYKVSEFLSTYSGRISPSDNYPACTAPAKIINIGRIDGTQSGAGYTGFITIKVYFTHRGYNPTSYYGYREWVLLVGDHVSANLVASSGSADHITLWNGSASGLYNNINIAAGFNVQLRMAPTCGSGFNAIYTVEYTDALRFTPATQREW